MKFKEEITKAMTFLAKDDRVLFLGQSIRYPGHLMYGTLEGVPHHKKIELPVAEDMQMGMSIGLALKGLLPVSIYPRMDFLVLAYNQLVNHLDKIEEMSHGRFKPKVIIRTMVGSIVPFYSGAQHCQDHTDSLKACLTNIDVIKITESNQVFQAYWRALYSHRSTILIEAPPKREGYED